MVATVSNTTSNSASSVSKKPISLAHPYDPLTPAEIRAAVKAIRDHVAKGGYEGAPINPLFNTAATLEPPKYDVLRWSGLFSEKELAASAPKGWKSSPIKRQADVSSRHVTLRRSVALTPSGSRHLQ